MKPTLQRLVAVAILATGSASGIAQTQPYVIPMAATAPAAVGAVGQQEMDAILAPIALYPDALLAHILMAATYPEDVTEAARWSRAIPGVPAEDAVRSVANRGWDYSVQALMAFPQILDMMDRAPDWTRRLGQAFLTQQTQVWATVQAMRQRAYTAGHLRSSPQLRVLFNGALIVLEPAQPDVVYVPYYDPLRVYGTWWWPGYAPMRWDPWPGYVVRPTRGVVSYYTPGPGVTIGLNFFFGSIDWYTQRIVIRPAPRWIDHRHDERRWTSGHPWEHQDRHRSEDRKRKDDHRHDEYARPHDKVPPARVVVPTTPAPSAMPHVAPQPRDGGKEWRSEPPRPSGSRGDQDRGNRGSTPARAPHPENGADVPSATSRMLHQPPKVQNGPAAKPEPAPVPRKSEPAAQPQQAETPGNKPAKPQEQERQQERRFNPKESGARTY